MAYTDQALRDQLFMLNEAQRKMLEEQDARDQPLGIPISQETMCLAADATFGQRDEKKRNEEEAAARPSIPTGDAKAEDDDEQEPLPENP